MKLRCPLPKIPNSSIVSLCCCLVDLLLDGLTKMNGILFVSVQNAFHANRQRASMPFALCVAVKNISGPFVRLLGQKYGPGSITLVGGLLSAAAVGLCSLSNNIYQLSVTWGAIFGVGYSMGTVLMPVIMSSINEEKVSPVPTVPISGVSVAYAVLPLVLHLLLATYEINGTFLILCGLVLHCVPLSMLIIIFGPSDIYEYFPFRKKRTTSQLYNVEISGESNSYSTSNNVQTTVPPRSYEKNYAETDSGKGTDSYEDTLEPTESFLSGLSSEISNGTGSISSINDERLEAVEDVSFSNGTRQALPKTQSAPVLTEVTTVLRNDCILHEEPLTNKTLVPLSNELDIENSNNLENEMVGRIVATTIEEETAENGVSRVSKEQEEICKNQQSKTNTNLISDLEGEQDTNESRCSSDNTSIISKTCATGNEHSRTLQASNEVQIASENNVPLMSPKADGKVCNKEINTVEQRNFTAKNKETHVTSEPVKSRTFPDIRVSVVECIITISDNTVTRHPGDGATKRLNHGYRRHANSVSYSLEAPNFSFDTKARKASKFARNAGFCPHAASSDEKIIRQPKDSKMAVGLHRIMAILCSLRICKNRTLVCLALALTVYEFIFTLIITIITDYYHDVGGDERGDKWIFLALFAGNVFGKLCFRWTTEITFLEKSTVAALCFLGTSAIILGMAFAQSLNFLPLFAAGLGIFESRAIIMFPILVKQYVDEKAFNLLLSNFNVWSGVAILGIPYALGAFRDDAGSYSSLLYIISGISLFGSLLCFVLPWIKGNRTCKAS